MADEEVASASRASGRSVVVTRARTQASALRERIEALGLDVVEAPVIDTAEPLDGGAALRSALEGLDQDDWLVVTSPNGARVVIERLGGRLPDRVRVAAVGPGTEAVLAAGGVTVDLVPRRSIAEGLLDVFPAPTGGGGRVLLARAEVARAVLPDGLRRIGWQVDEVAAYRTVACALAPSVVTEVGRADVVAFTSSSTVRNLVAAVGTGGLPPVVASIGPATSATVRALGLRVAVEADPHDLDGLVDAVQRAVATR